MAMVNPDSIQQLKSFICAITDVPDDEWSYFVGQLVEREYKKKQMLLYACDNVSEIYFITKGLVRYFYLTDTGKEFNKSFIKENNFAGSISAIALNRPSRFFIQAIEDTKALALPIALISECYERHPSWERLGRRLAERTALQKELREAAFLLDSAESRYLQFLEEFPDIPRRIPQYHIASYLGITEVSLSRIRKKHQN